MSKTTASIAFFGATGGVTNTCLVHALLAGIHCIALVRTPSKLRQQLIDQGISESIIDGQLSITQGNALDKAVVKNTILPPENAHVVSTIVTGLGGTPRLQFDWCHPGHIATLDNPTVCADAATAVTQALEEIYLAQPSLRGKKPKIVTISTTGITRGPEDVPFAMRFFYHQMLAVPHADKKNMENVYRADSEKTNDAEKLFKSVSCVRPTLLKGGADYKDADGIEKMRAGTEQKPALGFNVKRADVGHWIFENLVRPDGSKWEGEMVSLTM